MSTIPHARLQQILDRFEQIEARMNAATDTDEIVELSKTHAELAPVADHTKHIIQMREALAEAESLAQSDDKEMAALAREEISDLQERLPDAERAMQIMLLPKDKDDEASVVLEIRAGTGGDEAALFAGDLFRMYQRYASLQGWLVEIVSISEGEVGGYKEIVANISGAGAFGRLKFEMGVHRVQRVPDTESGGRIHTSAATVAILPAPENIDIEILDKDLRIDTMRASGSGGQHVNKTDSAVRMTHIPTGIVVLCSEKSQHQNRAKAMEILKVRLYEKERDEAQSARAEARKNQVGSGDRSERIRTYNYPQGRVSDHRINLTLYKLDNIVAGDGLDEVITTLLSEDEAARLAAQNSGEG